MYHEVLTFWFDELQPKMWWAADAQLDATIRTRFLEQLQQATQGELFAWRTEAKGRLAEIIVLDQFSRNIYRNRPQAFYQDPAALILAQEAFAAGAHHELSQTERSFLFMPFMHSESRVIHVWAERLFREHCASHSYDYELKHKAIIDRFGRYPHRNEILGRTSSAEEIEFLKQPGSRF